MAINRLMESVRELCASRVLEEKWLLAPSLRVGMQWLDAVTRSGQPVLNARVKTFPALALELAAPEMQKRGLSYLRGVREELLAGRLLAALPRKGGYLARIGAGPGLARAVAATLRDLRLAGIAAGDLSPRSFEVAAKGREIIALLSAYEKELSSRDLVDYAGVLRLAARRLATDPSAVPPQALVAAPEDLLEGISGLERALWQALPDENRTALAVDRPCAEAAGAAADSALLAWVARPAEAPSPAGDGSVELFRAVGEVNEVREVLRRCLASRIPLDEVEVLHSDTSTYLPLFYEVCSLLPAEPGGELPVTFMEGIPVRYCRPGRAFAAWLSWIREGFPQSTLVRMVQDGLLHLDSEGEAGGFSHAGAVLRSLPIGKGRQRYLAAIAAELEALEWRRSARDLGEDDGEEKPDAAAAEKRERTLAVLRDMVTGLLAAIPEPASEGEGPQLAEAWLRAAEDFLAVRARGVNEFDEYGRLRLIDHIRELRSGIAQEGAAPLDIPAWLAKLVRSDRVEGKGPRPGCLYVAPLEMGGHSGRPYTFIVGLDDGRFPTAGRQDPLLLDAERAAICDDLPTAAKRIAAGLEDFSRLAARLRGRVTLSYCCRSLSDDSDMFPSPALLAAYRVVSGDREAVQEDLLSRLPEPVSFAPQDPGSCIDLNEWWLHRLCGEQAVKDPVGTVARAFPHLGRGLASRRARESDLFTAYDGCVPEAGADQDPAGPDGPVLSASRLEVLGRCPLEYFFAYILGVKPPEEYLFDPYRWLEPTEKGRLLHAVFHAFHLRLAEQDRRPLFARDWDLLRSILEEEMKAWERRKPPPNREVYETEAEELRRCARIFLQEEEGHCAGRHPLYFEVAIGMGAESRNRIDSPQPVEIGLPGGRSVRTRGYIDRIDELGEPGSRRFSVCDYKTGSSFGHKREDPFRQGRRIQNLIYLLQAQRLLEPHHPGAEVASFQYFFPSTREHGERIEWSATELEGGMRVLELLCEMLASGCFPFSDDQEDVSISDYLAAFGDVEARAEAMKAKLRNPANRLLSPFRQLRGYGEEGGG